MDKSDENAPAPGAHSALVIQWQPRPGFPAATQESTNVPARESMYVPTREMTYVPTQEMTYMPTQELTYKSTQEPTNAPT